MSTEAERRREMRKILFPLARRVWFARSFHWTRPVGKGSDEWGRHTFWISIPFVGAIVVAYKWCGCRDVWDEMHCHFPGCPALSTGGVVGEPMFCPSHDEDFARRYIAGEYEDDVA